MPVIMCSYCEKLSSQHDNLEMAWAEIKKHEKKEHKGEN